MRLGVAPRLDGAALVLPLLSCSQPLRQGRLAVLLPPLSPRQSPGLRGCCHTARYYDYDDHDDYDGHDDFDDYDDHSDYDDD